MIRYLKLPIQEDLKNKMVFLGGPRQVGKTTLSKQIDKSYEYLNWDISSDRRKILDQEWSPLKKLLIFDEIHKFKKWRNFLKGIYDSQDRHLKKILVTGSARLDHYRFGGEALQGRYHYHRLHPLSVCELKLENSKDLTDFFNLSPFPEPCLSASKKNSDRWSLEYRTRLRDEDVRDLEGVQDLGQIELLVRRLPELVGSPLSLNNLREDLDVSFRKVKNWIEILERFYSIFRLLPLGANNRLRAVKKEQKHYHFDWNLVKDPGHRFENFIASHLLKWVHHRIDAYGEDRELRFFRDTEGREVDFILLKDSKVTHLIEAKLSETSIHPDLRYLKRKFPHADAIQLTLSHKKDFIDSEGIRLQPCLEFLKSLV